MPSITQLEYLVAVDHFKHFGKAAQDRNVSQPSLSIQIHKVEEELGLVIFDRDAKPIRTTPKGTILLEQARAILREHQRLLDLSRMEVKEPSGPLRLAVIPTLTPYLVPLFLPDFSRKFPKVQTLLTEMQTANIIEDLLSEKLDAALLATPLHEAGLKEEPLFYEPFHVYHSPNHEFSKKKTIRQEDLEHHPAWVLSDGHCFRDQMLSFCSQAMGEKVLPNVQFQSGNFETLRSLVDRSDSYTLFPKLFVDQLPKSIRNHQVKNFRNSIPTREISLIYKRQVWKADILDALKETLVKNLPEDLRAKSKNQEVLDV